MRKESKKNIVSKKQNEKNPYRNSQSEAYHKMKEKMQNEKSGVSLNSDNISGKLNSDNISGKKKQKKGLKKIFRKKKHVNKGSLVDNSSNLDNAVTLKNKKSSKENIKSTEMLHSGKTDLKRRGIIQERRNKNRKVISKSRKVTSLIFFVALLVSFVFIILIYRNTQIVKLKYDINELNKELLNLQNEKEILEVQMESNNRSDVIEKRAREQLGMDYPKEDKITYIKVN